MKAAILAVGSELLGTERLDTNSLRLTAVLDRWGIELVAKAVVPDDLPRIAAELLRWSEEVELVLVSGGLGPTADDLTRAAAARAFDRLLAVDEEVVESIRRRFEAFGRTMPEVNRRQAEVIGGAELLDNPSGTAPGQRLAHGLATVFLFPGVPRELDGMVTRHLEPWLLQTLGGDGSDGGSGVDRTTVKVASLPESEVEQRLAPVYERFGRRPITVLASPGEIRIVAEARGSGRDRRERLAELADAIVEAVGAAVFTRREGETLEAVVGDLLRRDGLTVATAESCTGGLLAERLTRLGGSSDYFPGGVVTYSNAAKTALLGVDAAAIEEHGAVSEPVARAMAAGVRERWSSDYGLAITGVAGPGGGSEAKPVGTVHVAMAAKRNGAVEVVHRRARFPGDRTAIRLQASQLALELVRRHRLGIPVG